MLNVLLFVVPLYSTLRCTRDHCRDGTRQLTHWTYVTALTIQTHSCHSHCFVTCTSLHMGRTSTDLTQRRGRLRSVVFSCMLERHSKGLETVCFSSNEHSRCILRGLSPAPLNCGTREKAQLLMSYTLLEEVPNVKIRCRT